MDDRLQADKNKPISGLYLVATPIGNLRDITLRALDVLTHADLVVCEDTRVSNVLLSSYGIKKKFFVYNDHSAERDRNTIINTLIKGAVVALISDAGTPLISDPGYKLVRAVREQNIPVMTVPGPCSPIAALTISGLPTDRFLFEGFLPSGQKARRERLEELQSLKASIIFFERANRVADSLGDVLEVLGNRQAAITRELTKKFEEARTGSITELVEGIGKTELLGEVVVIIGPPEETEYKMEDITTQLEKLMEKLPLSEAVKELSRLTGVNRKKIYQEAIKLQK